MIQQSFQTAAQLHEAGKLDEAEAIYRQILAEDPRQADSMHLLGVIAGQRCQFDSAVELIRQAIAIRPQVGQYYSNLALVFKKSNQPALAAACIRQALAFDSNDAVLFYRLGSVLHDLQQYGDAEAALAQAIRLRPDAGNYHYLHGIMLSEQAKNAEALAAFDKTLELMPQSVDALSNRGSILTRLGRRAEARACLDRTIQIDPKFWPAYNNLGNLLETTGHWTDACQAYRQAVELAPNDVECHWNYARMLLLLGQWKEGWEHYEWRLKKPKLGWYRDFSGPQWDGSDPAGKTILAHLEGGYGDVLHFVRFATPLARRGARVVLECPPDMTTLLKSVAEVSRLTARGQPRPEYDWHFPLQSLPRIFGITPQTVPNEVPYLSPPPSLTRRWAQRLAGETKLRVGLVWAGSYVQSVDYRTRSIDIYAPLAQTPGVRFFSLQIGPDSRQTPPPGMELLDYTAELNDFADTAALVQNLDLVIAVDTSVGHLAGALGKPVWILVPFNPFYLWMLHRPDTPWYPTMRLFRQPAEGDWQSPISQMAAALRELAR